MSVVHAHWPERLRAGSLVALLVATCLAVPVHGAEKGKEGAAATDADSLGRLHGPARGMYWMVNLPASSKDTAMVETTLAKSECLDGLFIRINWDDIERAKGEFDWSALDWAVGLARKHGLQYKVMLLPGMHTPAWVYEEGAEAFSTSFPWPLRKKYGKPTRIPLPWDEVYQHYFRRVMEEFSDRYREDEHFVAVTLTGVNFVYGEMHLPKSEADRSRWENYDNYAERIEQTYKDLTDFYAELFPKQQFVLHVTMPIPGMGENVDDLVQYGAHAYPARFTLQNAQLTGHQNNRGMFSYRLISRYKNRVHVGFQSLNAFTSFEERVGNAKVAVYNLVKADGEYWELLAPDGRDEAFVCDLAEEVERARTLGPEQYRKQLVRVGEFTDEFTEQRRRMREYVERGAYEEALLIMEDTFRFIFYDIRKRVDLLQKAGRSEEAVRFLQSIIQRRNTAAFRELLAATYAEAGAVDKAARNLEQAYRLSENSRYLIDQGTLYAKNGRREEAIAAWRQFLKAQDRSEAAYERVATLYCRHGFEQALGALRAEAARWGVALPSEKR